MLYVRTYVRTCARSQGVRKVVKSEGAGTQTIRNLGIKVHAIKSIYRNKEVSYSHKYTLGAIYGIIRSTVAMVSKIFATIPWILLVNFYK